MNLPGFVSHLLILLTLSTFLWKFSHAKPALVPAAAQENNNNGSKSADANPARNGHLASTQNKEQAAVNGANTAGHNQPPPPAPVDAISVIAQHPACKDDVHRICVKKSLEGDDGLKDEKQIQHNFEVLDCFMSYEGDEEPPSAACQTVIYQYKQTLTKDECFETAAKEVCKDFIKESKVDEQCSVKKKGAYLPCLMEMANYVEDEKDVGQNCNTFLNKMQRIVFTDYHLVHGFQEACGGEISRFKCGYIFDEKDEKEEEAMMKHHNQGWVIGCLIREHFAEVSQTCRQEILRVSELQADDYHLDRPLFFACRDDRERHCKHVQSGEGMVYRCLMEQQKQGALEQECAAQLMRREKVMEEDIKADKTFFTACRSLLKETGCVPDPSKEDIHSMSETLTCMMDAEANAEKDFYVDDQCQEEIELFQSNLMNEYQISAGIVNHCQTEIRGLCQGLKKAHQKDGTVHCLMSLAMPSRHKDVEKPPISEQCKAEVSKLMDETRPASVLAIDGFLMEQCASQLQQFCQNNPQPIDCLMDQIRGGKVPTTSECARHLLELEYFVSRNYKHDMRLVKACHKTIKDYNLDHHLTKKEQGAPSDGLVFAQLYKQVRMQLEGQTLQHAIDKKCVAEVLRCVHERAVNIDLNPELEEACLYQLTTTCHKAEFGEELACLEEHVEEIPESTDSGKPGCREMVEEYIMSQDSDYQLDTILMQACEPSIRKHCEHVVNGIEEGEIDEGEIFECLLEHKFDEEMDPKCFAGIEHHQLINMQDFNFNHKFREACKADFKKLCSKAKSKSDAVYCLSEAVRDDTLMDDDPRVSQKCRSQLKVEFLALEDTIQMDKEFEEACKADVKNHCSDVKPHPDAGSTDLYLTCIKSVDSEELKKSCAKYVFKITKLGNAVAGASNVMFRRCKAEIKRFCKSYTSDPEKLLGCLDEHYEEASTKCQDALDGEEQENQDIRLSPVLYSNCRTDIDDFCHKEMNRVHESDDSLHGAVINCLKLRYLKGEHSGLTESCSNQMHLLMVKVQTSDYKLDYVLTHMCKKHIKDCSKHEKGETEIIDCLKEKLIDSYLNHDMLCQHEVFRLITENRVDIQTDNELYDECKEDIQKSECKTVPYGSGRVMSCLLSLYEKDSIRRPKCKEMVKSRKELWELLVKLPAPRTLKDVWDGFSSPPPYWIIPVVAGLILALLVAVGIFCTVARRRARESNKGPLLYTDEQKPLIEQT